MPIAIRPYAPTDKDWVLQCEVELQEHERAIHDTRLPGIRIPRTTWRCSGTRWLRITASC
jgi:hypothetical protein